MTRCPHCTKVLYPAKDENGKIIWKNVLKVDWTIVGVVIGILLMLYGFHQVNDQCFDLLENPCKTAETLGCQVLPDYSDTLYYGNLQQEPLRLPDSLG